MSSVDSPQIISGMDAGLRGAIQACVAKLPVVYYMNGNHDMGVQQADLAQLGSGGKQIPMDRRPTTTTPNTATRGAWTRQRLATGSMRPTRPAIPSAAIRWVLHHPAGGQLEEPGCGLADGEGRGRP